MANKISVLQSTGNIFWGDTASYSDGNFRMPVNRPYTHDDVTPKHPDFIWCEWCGSKNHYTDLKCSSCGGTL